MRLKSVVSNRVWSKTCGGHVYTDHPTMGLIDVPAAVIKNLNLIPRFMFTIRNLCKRMKDGLPKFKDLPKEDGGSGAELPE